MNTRHVLILSIIAFSFAACHKENAVKVTSHPTTDSPVVVVTYPYTDTFAGDLYMYCTYEGTQYYDTTLHAYRFYVLHSSADSLAFISSDTISEANGQVPDRFFDNSYAVVSNNIYRFNNYFYGDGQDVQTPVNNIDSFSLQRPLLMVNWMDMDAVEIRLSHPAGGISYTKTFCSYTGTLVAH